VKTANYVRSELRDLLEARQLPSGGWPYLAAASQAAIEPTCLSLLALGGDSPSFDRGRGFLRHAQNPNGSWPAFIDDIDGSWTTAMALIALRDSVRDIEARLKAFSWLLHSSGREGHWFWRWKFRTTDRRVRFDPDKYGWPWMPDTNSWVVPTACAMLALKQLPCDCGFVNADARIRLGVHMLLDRACPAGGWNAGNGVVYGVPLAPHPDATAIALLALNESPRNSLVESGRRWLASVADSLSAPWSLSWSILALAAYRSPVGSLLDTLTETADLNRFEDNASLALTLLALDPAQGLDALGVKT
jgi:hypothetical protein